MVPRYIGVHIGGDPYHKMWNGQIRNWWLNAGDDAWIEGDDFDRL